MKRKEALKAIFSQITNDDLVVSTTGLISREIYEKYDSPRNFYMPGSMGLVSSIGLGLALAQDKNVVAIDGDASLLMNFGTLVTLGKWQPNNLVHIVLDNGAYGSCSEEKSMSETARFAEVAELVGYEKTFDVSDESSLKDAIINSRGRLSFIRIRIELGGRRDFARPLDLVPLKRRFMNITKGDDRNDVQR